MSTYVFGFQDLDKTKLRIAGGKGASLGELSRIEGIHVPEGFCISAEAFKRLMEASSSVKGMLERLSLLKVEDRDAIRELSAELRGAIEGIAIPEALHDEITDFHSGFGENNAYAVRSSATAEDLPTASFAGQQDTYLNVVGTRAILEHIRKCWASLFTERAVIYRLQNGFDHRCVHMAVVVQKMVCPVVSGIMFTADPVTSNRKVLSIDAGFGLGEALVSGMMNPDVYKVRDGRVTARKIAAKKLAIHPLKDGGTKHQTLEPERQEEQALRDEQILQLARIGRKIEAHFGQPQDIEWCLADDGFHVVQSRPITTLYPIPEAADRESHVYVSVGHQQMMTDPIKPLGLSFFQLTAVRPMFTAGGRLFVDIAQNLASPAGRDMILNVLGRSEPLIKDALLTLLAQDDFIKEVPDDKSGPGTGNSNKSMLPAGPRAQVENDPTLVADLIKGSQRSIAELKQNIQAKAGVELFDFILEDLQRLKKLLVDPRSFGVIRAAMDASSWLNEKIMEWLGEKNVADTLSQSVPNNITSEMGLELMNVADVVRSYPEVIGYLKDARGDSFWDGLVALEGGPQTRDALLAYLDKYGMRCAGEIDITKARWSENPIALVPTILNNIKSFEPGASNRKFRHGLQEALKKEQELLGRLKQLPEGERKAEEAERMIRLVRNFIGYREYPKYGMVSRYFIYRQALLKEAERLVGAGVIHEKEDIYYLAFEELRELVRTKKPDDRLIRQRKDEYRLFEKLTPPRVLTSEGEVVAGAYKREHLPAGALAGLAVSSGVIEGRARVILTMEDAELEDGDILVTSFTDPGWTPVFVSIKGLVTEVGGLMTHGAVIAREYGLPAVVGVEHATQLIKDGQRIRVNGTDGYVELL